MLLVLKLEVTVGSIAVGVDGASNDGAADMVMVVTLGLVMVLMAVF